MDHKKFMKLLGERVKSLRKSKSLSQEDLASIIGKSVETISNIERGKFSPRIETALEISKALDISLSELFQFQEISVENKKCLNIIESILEKIKAEPEEILEFIHQNIQDVVSLKQKLIKK